MKVNPEKRFGRIEIIQRVVFIFTINWSIPLLMDYKFYEIIKKPRFQLPQTKLTLNEFGSQF